MSLGAGIIVGVAETVVFAAYLRNVEIARQREGRRREVRSVIAVDKVGTRSLERNEGISNMDGEKEEIWGRGVNRGVRRRVRERWEKEEKKLEEKMEGKK